MNELIAIIQNNDLTQDEKNNQIREALRNIKADNTEILSWGHITHYGDYRLHFADISGWNYLVHKDDNVNKQPIAFWNPIREEALREHEAKKNQ